MGGSPAAEPARRRRLSRDAVRQVLALTVGVSAVLLVAAVGLLVAFGHDALVAADARHLAWQHGRASTDGAALAAVYASTLEPVDRGGAAQCFAPRERGCLDGFCSLGKWRDHRRARAFPCKGTGGAGLPSYELFERAVTAAGALGAAVVGGVLLAAALALAVDDAGAPRFFVVAAPAFALHALAAAVGVRAFFRAAAAAAAVASPHPAAGLAATAHFSAVLGRGCAAVTACLAAAAAAVARLAPAAAPAADVDAEYEAWRLAPAPDPDPVDALDR